MRLPAADKGQTDSTPLSAAALEEADTPRVVCATLLVRVLPAGAAHLRGDPPVYSDAVYDSTRCYPSEAEQKLYKAKVGQDQRPGITAVLPQPLSVVISKRESELDVCPGLALASFERTWVSVVYARPVIIHVREPGKTAVYPIP